MINAAGAKLLTKSEGIRLKAYKCPAGKWTIGRGHTKGVKEGDTISAEQERVMFTRDMQEWEFDVLASLKRAPNENQLAAFICFAFNIGLDGFKKSSVVKAFERGDDAAAARAFGLWNKITVDGKKVVSDGLVSRRAAEAELFARPAPGAIQPLMPQAVVPESAPQQSPINRASVVAGGSAAVATVAETARSMADIKQAAGDMGDWLVPILLVIIIAAVGYIAWQRYQQRKGGWA